MWECRKAGTEASFLPACFPYSHLSIIAVPGVRVMGMDQKVTFDSAAPFTWPVLRDRLTGCGMELQMRMIDGELAFPDEEPPDGWRELRLGTPAGMVTLRREPDGVRLVIWGNADPLLRQVWNSVTLAVAAVSKGRVETEKGRMTAEEFAQFIGSPPGTQGGAT
jgi:hypothetical protein